MKLRSRELRRLARVDRRSRRRPGDIPRVLLAAAGAAGVGYLVASWPGVALALASSAVGFRTWTVPIGVGIGLALAGGVATLLEADMVRSLRFATDRPTAAALVQSGMVVVTAAVAVQLVISRAAASPPGAPPLSLPTPRQRRFVGEAVAVGAIGFGAWRVLGPSSLPTDLDLAVRRLDDGMALAAALEGLGAETRAALFPVTATAMGPVAGSTLGCLALAAGAAGTWIACKLARWQPAPAVAWLLVAATIGAATVLGGDLADAMAVGLTAAATGLMMTKTPAGILIGSVLLGLATLCRPETVLVSPFVLFVGYDADARQGTVPLLAPLLYVATLWPWTQWSERNLDRSIFASVDVGTTARVAVPVLLVWVALAGARSLRRVAPREPEASEPV